MTAMVFVDGKVGNKYLHLKKKHFSDLKRIIFFAGLEGTGHHGMKSFVTVCRRQLKPSCDIDVIVNDHMFHRVIKQDSKSYGLFMTRDISNTVSHANIILERMKNISRDSEPHLFFLGLESPSTTFMASYPNTNSAWRMLSYPDVYALANFAEIAGVDFRVVVLLRNALDVLESTRSRGFGGRQEAKVSQNYSLNSKLFNHYHTH
jgi:hypothetical protein